MGTLKKIAEKYIDPNKPEFEYKEGKVNYPQYNEYLKRLVQNTYAKNPNLYETDMEMAALEKLNKGAQIEPTALDKLVGKIKGLTPEYKQSLHYQNIAPVNIRDLEEMQGYEITQELMPTQMQNVRSSILANSEYKEPKFAITQPAEQNEMAQYQRDLTRKLFNEDPGKIEIRNMEDYGQFQRDNEQIYVSPEATYRMSTVPHEMMHKLVYESNPEAPIFKENLTTRGSLKAGDKDLWKLDALSNAGHIPLTMERPENLPTEEYKLPMGVRAEMYNLLKKSLRNEE